MKSPIILSLILAITTPLLSSEIPEINCREYVSDSSIENSVAEAAELDLLQGIWVKNEVDSPSKITFHFNKSGRVDIISTTPDQEARYSHAHWTVEEQNGEAILVWEEHNETDRLLIINQVCEGIILSDYADGKEYLLNYIPKLGNKKIDFMRASLLGRWENATYPFDIAKNENDYGTFAPIEGAYLDYKFNKDGSYIKKWGSTKVEFTETGKWDISKDGKFLVMRASSKNDIHEAEITYLAKIKMVDMDKIVLEQSLQSPNIGNLYTTQNKDFLFVK
jgi:hypothetical protein